MLDKKGELIKCIHVAAFMIFSTSFSSSNSHSQSASTCTHLVECCGFKLIALVPPHCQ